MLDLTALWSTLRVTGIVALGLALLLGPFLIVVCGEGRHRRRARREEEDAANRIIGGWDEYVDAAVDHGLLVPRAETREELAALTARPAATGLAVAADRAVFSQDALTTPNRRSSGVSSMRSAADSLRADRCGRGSSRPYR